MHKLALTLILILTIMASYLAIDKAFSGKREEDVSQKITNVSLFADLKTPLFFTPISLSFFKSENITHQMLVEEVGVDSDGKLQVPSLWSNAGWYVRSARPGEVGNMIISGHYDTDSSAPAAFWGLKNLKGGDKVLVRDELGRDFYYEVYETYYVDILDPQRTQAFGETDEVELTLVTCGGIWDYVEGTYNKRLVVRARLVSTANFASSSGDLDEG